MYTEMIIKKNPVVLCMNKEELIKAGKLFEENTEIKGYYNQPPTKFCERIYDIFGRIQRTNEPSYLTIHVDKDGGYQLKIGFDDPELFYRKNRIVKLDEFKNLFEVA